MKPQYNPTGESILQTQYNSINNNRQHLISTFTQHFDWIKCRSELTRGAKEVYCTLARMAKGRGFAFPSHETIAKTTGYSKRSIVNYMKELTRHELILVKRMGKRITNRYVMLDHPWMKFHIGFKKQHQPVENPQKPPVDKWGGEVQKLHFPNKREIYLYNNNYNNTARAYVRPTQDEYDEFLVWWDGSHKRGNRERALQSYLIARQKLEPPRLLKWVIAYKEMCYRRNNEKYALSCYRWLDEEGWKNEDIRNYEIPERKQIMKEQRPNQSEWVVPTEEQKVDVREFLWQSIPILKIRAKNRGESSNDCSVVPVNDMGARGISQNNLRVSGRA